MLFSFEGLQFNYLTRYKTVNLKLFDSQYSNLILLPLNDLNLKQTIKKLQSKN